MKTSEYDPLSAAPMAAATSAYAALMRGQLVVLRTSMAITLDTRFCWYLRFISVVTSTSKPRASATASSAPLFSVDQPCSYAVDTSCPGRRCRSGAGVPWSKRTRTYAAARALRATCSSTSRACCKVTPGKISANWLTGIPSSRFSKSAATGTRVPRNTQAPLTRSGSRSTAVQVDQSIMVTW